jgi:hypothetical protein
VTDQMFLRLPPAPRNKAALASATNAQDYGVISSWLYLQSARRLPPGVVRDALIRCISGRQTPTSGAFPSIRICEARQELNTAKPVVNNAAFRMPHRTLEYRPYTSRGFHGIHFSRFRCQSVVWGLESPAFCRKLRFACYSSKTTPAMPN